MKVLISLVVICWGMSFVMNNEIGNKALDKLSVLVKNHNELAEKKIKIRPFFSKRDPDIDIIVSLKNRKNLITGHDIGIDTVNYQVLVSSDKLLLPKRFRSKCLSKYDYEGEVFNTVEINKNKYIEIKLQNKNLEIFYFILEFNSTGAYQTYYYQYLIY